MNRLLAAYTASLLLLVLFAGSCGDREAPHEAPEPPVPEPFDRSFASPQFPPGRSLDTLLAVDLLDDGELEYVVASRADTGYAASGARADLLQIYRFDSSARRYVPTIVDSVQWITTIELRDVTGDRVPEVVARIHSGGNDPVASEGMFVYGNVEGHLRPIFRSRRGMPRWLSVPGMKQQAIAVHEEIWPLFAAHVDAVVFIDDLFAYRGDRYRSAGSELSTVFRRLANERLDAYRDLRSTLGRDSITGERAMGLFAEAAQVIQYLGRAAAASALRAFWDSEHEVLKSRLPEEYAGELEAMYVQAMNL